MSDNFLIKKQYRDEKIAIYPFYQFNAAGL
jgi:hypothetical protein